MIPTGVVRGGVALGVVVGAVACTSLSGLTGGAPDAATTTDAGVADAATTSASGDAALDHAGIAEDPCANGASYEATVMALPGLVSYWRLDETTGTTANDLVGTNAGTYANATLRNPSLLANDDDFSILLNGTNGRVDIPSSPSLTLTTEMTLSALVKPTATDQKHQVFAKENTYWLQILNDGIEFAFVDPNGQVNAVHTTGLSMTNVSHVLGTYDGSSLVIYINGVVAVSSPASGQITMTDDEAHIGAWSATQFLMAGAVDEVFVTNQAVSSDQASALYSVALRCKSGGN